MSAIAGVVCITEDEQFNLIEVHCDEEDLIVTPRGVAIGNLFIPQQWYEVIQFVNEEQINEIKNGANNPLFAMIFS